MLDLYAPTIFTKLHHHTFIDDIILFCINVYPSASARSFDLQLAVLDCGQQPGHKELVMSQAVQKSILIQEFNDRSP